MADDGRARGRKAEEQEAVGQKPMEAGDSTRGDKWSERMTVANLKEPAAGERLTGAGSAVSAAGGELRTGAGSAQSAARGELRTAAGSTESAAGERLTGAGSAVSAAGGELRTGAGSAVSAAGGELRTGAGSAVSAASGPMPGSEPAELAADARLHAAIRAGLERGKRRSRPRRRRRLGLALAAALVSLLAMTAGAAKVSPAFAAALRSVPALSGFLRLIGESPALLSSIDRDLLQVVGRTAEKDGKRLTVEALVADERRLVVFYRTNLRMEGLEPTRLDVKDAQGKLISASYGHFSPDAQDGPADEAGARPDMIDVQMSPDESLPERVLIEAEQDGVVLQVPLDIDLGKTAGLVREFPMNRTLEVDGQKLTVVSARQTPLQLELRLHKDSANTMDIRNLLNLRLTDESGREWRSTGGFLGDEPVLFYQNGYFQKPKSLTLRADGFVMFAKGQKIVVDSEKRLVLKAPDDRLSLTAPETSLHHGQLDVSNVLAFRLSGLDERESKYGYNLVSSTFTDGSGKKWEEVGTDRMIRSSMTSEGQTYYVKLPAKKLPQPLTFDVEGYPGYALHPIELEMRPE
ncbi:DUF4179 domain-containing protein [Paenibacillus albicereus]|uniref:DUF4179 domain-containing protein n=1 Tax=Paenibacillus albicereus TaxID=2726185 RepID=A0A6H2H1D4_9BACL|nr:DUF4179 domain-containing protein [Paenibacillus albicereus]QJC53480.1 DUF4179 domain-containing protein [Paenibacillus albicereus]